MKVFFYLFSSSSEKLLMSYIFQPKAVSDSEEQDLAQLMAKAGQENEEVAGDEDDED
jgi:hypothetical protein